MQHKCTKRAMMQRKRTKRVLSNTNARKESWCNTTARKGQWCNTNALKGQRCNTNALKGQWCNTNARKGPWCNTNARKGPWCNTNARKGPWCNTNARKGPWCNTNARKGPWCSCEIGGQCRPRLACAFLSCFEILVKQYDAQGPWCNMRTTQVQISMRICAVWSGSSKSAYRINGYRSTCRRIENVQIRLHDAYADVAFRCSHMTKEPISQVVHHKVISWEELAQTSTRRF